MIKASAQTLSFIVLLFLVENFSPSRAASQTVDTVQLEGIVKRAVDLMDRNLPEQAIAKWDSAIAIVSGNVQYRYERVVCFAMSKRYTDAITALEPIYRDTMLYDRGYQLMGNCYDYLEDTTKSMQFYRKGLERFPMSGRLHYELGAAAFVSGNTSKALEWWMKGTRVEPWFATNYYWVAKASAKTKDKIWTIFFGEIFINIEPATVRTKEIAALVFNTWNASMRLGDRDDPINFCSDELLDAPSPFGPATMNFATAFEFTVAQSSQQFIPDTGVRKRLTIEQLVDVRKKFIDGWNGAGYLEKYPNDLISWILRVKQAGWLNEYLWWVHGYGDLDEMRAYMQRNESRYDTFFGWLMENPFLPDHPLCLGIRCSD